MAYTLTIPETTAFSVEQQILETLKTHFFNKHNWIHLGENGVWVYIPASIETISRKFLTISFTAFMHLLRNMKKAGALWIQPCDGFTDMVMISSSRLDSKLFAAGGFEIVNVSRTPGRYVPSYRSQTATLVFGETL